MFAPVGSYVPGIDLTLTKAKIRMRSTACSYLEHELGVSDKRTRATINFPDPKISSPAGESASASTMR